MYVHYSVSVARVHTQWDLVFLTMPTTLSDQHAWRGVNPYIAVKYRKAFGVVSPQGYTPFAMALALAS